MGLYGLSFEDSVTGLHIENQCFYYVLNLSSFKSNGDMILLGLKFPRTYFMKTEYYFLNLPGHCTPFQVKDLMFSEWPLKFSGQITWKSLLSLVLRISYLHVITTLPGTSPYPTNVSIITQFFARTLFSQSLHRQPFQTLACLSGMFCLALWT